MIISDELAFIRDSFLKMGRSVDDLLCEPDDAKAFGEQMRIDLPAGHVYPTVKSVLLSLIRLRKIGEEKGGLPRRQRKFLGRKPK